MSSKQEIIANIYYDKGGFGSKAITLKDARAQDKTITMQDVEDFFRKNVEIKRKQRGQNSFVAPHNNYSYQLDLFFISSEDIETTQKFRAGLVMIDVLSKYAVVVPIKSKTPPDIIAGTMEGLQKMKAKPKMIYTDDERGIASAEFKEYVDGENIENDEEKGKAVQWIGYIFEIMLTYNNKDVHSATGLTPNEARKEKNEFKAKLNVSVKARKERTYPTLEVWDKVKIMRKKAITEKERTSNWLAGEYVVEENFEKLNQKYYRLNGYNRPLMRHELLKM